MTDFFNNGPLPDWKEIQKWLGKDIPWKLLENWDRRGDANWLNDYVKKIMQNSMPSLVHSRSSFHAETKQDAKTVSLSIKLDPDTDIRKLQMFATSERLKFTGLPGDKKRVVRFPSLVYPRSGKAEMRKDRTLVIRFKRRPQEKSEYELFIEP